MSDTKHWMFTCRKCDWNFSILIASNTVEQKVVCPHCQNEFWETIDGTYLKYPMADRINKEGLA